MLTGRVVSMEPRLLFDCLVETGWWRSAPPEFPEELESSFSPKMAEHLGIDKNTLAEGQEFPVQTLDSTWARYPGELAALYSTAKDMVARWFSVIQGEATVRFIRTIPSDRPYNSTVELEFSCTDLEDRDRFIDFLVCGQAFTDEY